MLKIGDFSKLSRVSIRMLRHYDEIGLLKPVETDPSTGYRYYRAGQLPVAGRIAALKEMGFGLTAIREMLSCFDDPAKLEAYLRSQRMELLALREETERRLRLLDTAQDRLRKEKSMKYDVTLKTLPQRYAACVRMTIPSYEQEGMLWKTLRDETGSMDLVPGDPCYCSVAYLDGEFKEHDVLAEAQKTVKGHYADTQNVKFRTLPPVTFASAAFKGPYDQIAPANEAVAHWVEANGYAFDGAMFNIYHVSPRDTDDPNEFVTEVCYPVKKK